MSLLPKFSADQMNDFEFIITNVSANHVAVEFTLKIIQVSCYDNFAVLILRKLNAIPSELL